MEQLLDAFHVKGFDGQDMQYGLTVSIKQPLATTRESHLYASRLL